jgi:hypothetical protein
VFRIKRERSHSTPAAAENGVQKAHTHTTHAPLLSANFQRLERTLNLSLLDQRLRTTITNNKGTKHGRAEKLPLYGVVAELGPLLTNSRSKARHCVCVFVGGNAHMRGQAPEAAKRRMYYLHRPGMRMESALCAHRGPKVYCTYESGGRRFSCSIFGALSAPLRYADAAPPGRAIAQ